MLCINEYRYSYSNYYYSDIHNQYKNGSQSVTFRSHRMCLLFTVTNSWNIKLTELLLKTEITFEFESVRQLIKDFRTYVSTHGG